MIAADTTVDIDKPSAGKTGTNNSNMAVWFVGYTPTIATAAMVAGANEQGQWLTLNGQLVGGSPIYEAFGSTVAGPIWGEAMAAASAKLAYEDFQVPPADEIAGVVTSVPEVSGMSVEQATATLEATGSTVADGGQVNSETGAGLVAYSSPGGGTPLSSGDVVDSLHLHRLRAGPNQHRWWRRRWRWRWQQRRRSRQRPLHGPISPADGVPPQQPLHRPHVP